MENYIDFKKYITHEIYAIKEGFEIQNNHEKNELQTQIDFLKTENKHLQNEIQSKQTIIDILMVNNNQKPLVNNNQKPHNQTDNTPTWQMPRKTATEKQQATEENTLNLRNRYNSLTRYHNTSKSDSESTPFGPFYADNNNKVKDQHRKSHRNSDGNYYNQHPERDHQSLKFSKRTYPGNSSYSRMAKKDRKVIVFSDSHGSRIHKKEFYQLIINGTATIKAFPGAKTAHLQHYIIPNITEEKPDDVVIMVGANDIRGNDNDQDIANKIVNVGRKCKDEGVNNVYICSLTCRANDTHRVKSINFYLKNMCKVENIIYINNDAITPEHLHTDGIHLVHQGTIILANNILHSINFYNRNNSIYRN